MSNDYKKTQVKNNRILTPVECFDYAPTFSGDDKAWNNLTEGQKSEWQEFILKVRNGVNF